MNKSQLSYLPGYGGLPQFLNKQEGHDGPVLLTWVS